MKKLISIAVFAVFSASSAMSAGIGFAPSIGVSFNQSAFAGEGNEKNFDESGSLRAVTEEYGAFTESFASIFLELGLGENFAIGVDMVPGSIATPENISREGKVTGGGFPDPGRSRVSVDFEDLTTVYLKANVPMLGGTYVKAGYAEVDVIVNESMASGNTYKDTSTQGMIAAIGYSHDLGSMGLSIRAEVMAHQFDDVKANNGVSAGGNRNEVMVESMWGARGIISLAKSF